ncbi:unnamed protein product [Caretta caretta]
MTNYATLPVSVPERHDKMSTQMQMIEAKITSDERNRLNYAVFLLDQPNGSVVGTLYGEQTRVQHCVDHYGLGIQKLDMTFFAFKRD